MSEGVVRCFNCQYFEPTIKYNGMCRDTREGRKPIRVIDIDYCDYGVSKKKREDCTSQLKKEGEVTSEV
jgi:hypothetical protein